ncbi:MAG: pectate lyase [Polyangiaceae bacterium]
MRQAPENSASGGASSGTTGGSSALGGAQNGGTSTGAGGASAGASSGGGSTGGAASGGAVSGGATNGGAVSGGASNGGTTSGGAASGGTTSGGAARGGASSGGAASGGTTNGGATSGGAASGGTTSGGAASGGTTNTGEVLAFPGAQGFGRLAVGARGKDVYHVTNLNDSGAGSLRDAISVANRTIVFDVGGVIKIASRLVFKSNQTIAGQTAPGGGITVYGDGTSFSGAAHTIVRYVRFRMGKIGEAEKDTVTIANGHDIIFDHCSLSWGRDGTFDLNQESGAQLYNITLQDSIVAQGLQTHSTGGLVNTTGTSIIRSLYIDNNSRNPKARGTLQFVNNVVYNWVVSGYILGDTTGRSDGAMIGNYLITGPETNGGTLDSPTPEYHMFAEGNYYDSNKDGTLNGRLLGKGDFGTVTWETAPSVAFPPVPAMTAQEAVAYVRAHAGTSLSRDPVDDYVMNELASFGKSGKTISDEASLGIPNVVGNIAGGTAPKDTDQDGMPDAWEQSNGLNPSNAADRNADRNGDGWTNLEEYINSLAK